MENISGILKLKATIGKSMVLKSILIGYAILLPILLVTAQSASAQSPISGSSDDDDLVILSHRFDSSSFSSEIIGEIMNNDTRSYDKFDIEIFANFRDSAGMLIGSEEGFIDAEELRPGQSSAFNVFVFGDDIEDQSSTYDLIINDERLVAGQPLNEEFDIEDDDSGDGGSDDNGDDADDNNGDDNDGNDNDNSDSLEIRREPLPYCDVLDDLGINGQCTDRYDYDEITGLYPCNDGTQKRDPLDCPDARGIPEPEDIPGADIICPTVISYGDGSCNVAPAPPSSEEEQEQEIGSEPGLQSELEEPEDADNNDDESSNGENNSDESEDKDESEDEQ